MLTMRAATRGMTLIETLVVVAIVCVLIVVVAVAARGLDAPSRLARELARALVVERWHAVAQGTPAVLRHEHALGVRRTNVGGFGCDAPTPASRPLVTVPNGLLVAWPSTAIAFAADGRPRSCAGGGVGNTTIRVTDRHGREAAVIVSSLGRVRWERR